VNLFPEADLYVLAAFGVATLVASSGSIFLSGFFPQRVRAPRLQGFIATILIWAALGATLLVAIAALQTAATGLPWAMTVVAGGGTFLLAPFLVEPLPERLRDSKTGIIIYLAVTIAVLAARPASLVPSI
jgi:hypothetical protein